MDQKAVGRQQSCIAKGASCSSNPNLIDINEATVEQLEMLAGVGRAKAEAIIDNRKQMGRFTSVGDLSRVVGIGKSLIDQNHSLLVCQCPASSEVPASLLSKNKATRRVARNRSVAAKLATRLQRKSARTAAASSMGKTVSYQTRSATSNAFVSSAEKAASSSAVSSSTTKSAASLPSTSSTHFTLVVEDTKTPHDVRASLEPLFEGCKRTVHSRLGVSRAEDVPDGIGSGMTSGTSTRCMALRSNCNGNSSEIATKSDRDLVFEDCSRDNGNSGRSGSDSCHEQQLCLSPKKLMPHDNVEKNVMKRKAEDLDYRTECKKTCFSCSNCVLNRDEACDGLHSLLIDTSTSVSKKQRIPSRKNPPAMMSTWIQIFQEWSHAERLIALDALVESCSPTQVRHIMQVIEPQFQRDFISFLPKELALYVLSFLDPRDLVRASQTCRYWRTLAEDNLLWREKCQEEGLSESFVFNSRLHRRRPDWRCGGKNGVTQWKCLYKRQRQIENNWSHGTLLSPKVLKGHDDHVITCLEFNGSKIVSGSDDNTLKVWSAVTGKCLRTLVGHTGGVWSSQMSGHMVISGSTDRTLKVWNIDSGQCVFTLYGHTSTVRCMHLHGNRLVSGSRDATLRIWDIDSGHCLRVLIGHVAAVRCVQFDGRRVVSGAYDYMVKIWDPETETCLQTLAGHTNRVYSLQFDGIHIVSGSLDTSIRVWNAETGSCLHTLIGHQSLTSGMELRDNILVSGNADSTVKVWNITTGQCLQTLQGANKHQSAVTCLQFNRRFVVTSSDDGTVKIWDLRTGEFLRNLVALDSGGSGGVVWRIRCSNTTLVCAVGSRNGTEETKLLVLDFDLTDEDSPPSVSAVVD